MEYKIAVIPGDHIGPEVMAEGIKVLKKVGEVFDHKFILTEADAGGVAIDKTGSCLPVETLSVCRESDAVLLGAVGGPEWDDEPGENRPEKALLGLRKELGLYGNLRPATIFPSLKEASPLKSDLISDGLDILIVRELTGGIYFGRHQSFTYYAEASDLNQFLVFYSEMAHGRKAAFDIELYTEPEIERIARTAFEMAMKRNKRVTSVDKANVLDSSRLWRKTVAEVAKDYPEVELDNMYVDNAAMQLVRDPGHFDVLLTSNMFGDILSDEASQITGSIGMLPSASLADGNFGMYEPVHGSAPDIAGTGKANPLAMILSVSMMLKYTLNLPDEAEAIERAVNEFLEKGYRTFDIASKDENPLSTSECGDIIAGLIG